MLSFVLSGLGCAFAGLCYAEFAAMIPLAGSAYTYAYATLGELFAWIIGWDLTLEYAMGASTVCSGWSNHFIELLNIFTSSFRCGWRTTIGPGLRMAVDIGWPADHGVVAIRSCCRGRRSSSMQLGALKAAPTAELMARAHAAAECAAPLWPSRSDSICRRF